MMMELFPYLTISLVLKLVVGDCIPKPAYKGQFPFYVQIHDKNSNCTCGGSLISYNLILTTAHCLLNMEIAAVEVYAGTSKILGNDGVINFVSEIYVHPNYVPSSCSSRLHERRNNIALARLQNYYKLEEKLISPIKLVTPQQKYQIGVLVGVGNIYCNVMLDRSCMVIKFKEVYLEEKQYIRRWNIRRIKSVGVLFSEEDKPPGRFPWKDFGAPLICNCSKELEPVQFGLLASMWTNSSIAGSSALNIYESVTEHLWFITQYLSNVKDVLIRARKLLK